MKPKGDDPNCLAQFLEETEARSSAAGWRIPSMISLGAHLDVQFRGSPPSPPSPPALILDYVYGVAAFRAWGSRQDDEVDATMRDYRKNNYAHITPLLPQVDDDNYSFQQPDSHTSDDLNDGDYRGASTRRGDIMAAAMDRLNSVLMCINGTTPQEAAIRWEKRMKEEGLMAQEAGRSKVMEWMKTTAVGGSL